MSLDPGELAFGLFSNDLGNPGVIVRMQWEQSISGLGGCCAGEDAPLPRSVDLRLSGQLRVSCVKSGKSGFSVKKKQKTQHRKKAIRWDVGEGHTRVMVVAGREPPCTLRCGDGGQQQR